MDNMDDDELTITVLRCELSNALTRAEAAEARVEELEYKRNEAQLQVVELQTNPDEWRAALEGLTPKNQRFMGYPEACTQYVRQQWQLDAAEKQRLKARVKELEARLAAFAQPPASAGC